MIIGLTIAFLITLTILTAALAANKALKVQNALLSGDLAEADFDLNEAESDLREAESDNGDLIGVSESLRAYNDFLVGTNASLRRKLEASEAAYTLLKAAGHDLLESSDAYIDELEGEIDDLATALKHSLALNELQDATIQTATADAQYERQTADATIQQMLDTMVPVEELAALTNAVAAYDAVADKFIAKVEHGRARSTETYNELKDARNWNASVDTGSSPESGGGVNVDDQSDYAELASARGIRD